MSGSTLTAARGTLLSIALRLLSFLLSQLTVRFVSAATLGKASVPLELLLGTALFVGREGFRLALTKEIGGDGDDASRDGDVDDARGGEETESNKWRDQQQIANVSWLSVPIGAVLSLLALSMHLHGCSRKGLQTRGDTLLSCLLRRKFIGTAGHSMLATDGRHDEGKGGGRCVGSEVTELLWMLIFQ